MGKLFVNFILFFILTCSLCAQEKNEGIRFFEGSWEEALQKAQKENKLIFVDCYTDWCGNCINMARKTFPLKKVGDFFNKHFICIKSNSEKEGKAIAERYGVMSYPTFLFVNGEGILVHNHVGDPRNPDLFIGVGQKALELRGHGYEERFVKGERKKAFLIEYINNLLVHHQATNVEKVLNTLFEEQGIDILKDQYYWDAFNCCAAKVDAPLSLAFVKNYKRLSKIHGEFVVAQKERNIYSSIAQTMTLYEGEEWHEVLNEEKKDSYFRQMEFWELPHCKELQQEIEFIILLKGKQFQEAYSLGEKVLKEADARTLCNWATLGERFVRGNIDIRRKMASWMQRAIDAGVVEEMQTEAKAVLQDLQTQENPAFGPRKGIPTRGYLNK